MRTCLTFFLLTLSAYAEPLPEGAELAPPHNGYGYVPFKIEGAKLIPRVEHLQPGRDWERMDVYIPESSQSGDKLPCIVNVYGGGYGEKGVGTIKGVVKPLIDRGYVVATPDYALGVHAPEALASWDVAAAVRFLRANAERYNIDPERIGICGWSAGGWIAQFIGYAGPSDLRRFEYSKEDPHNNSGVGATPTLEPNPTLADHPIKLQAVVSDWGAGKLISRKGDETSPSMTLTPDDSPLLTCFAGKPRDMPNTSVGFLQDLGIPAEPVFLGDTKSTHVPKLNTPGWDAKGKACTWESAIYDFFDRTVKAPTRCSAPQILRIPATGKVKLLCVHATYGDGMVYYTVDGSEPTEESAKYAGEIEVIPGQTIKAISTKPDLPQSAVASYTIPELPIPYITTKEASFTAKVGKPLAIKFAAQMPGGADSGPEWMISGLIGKKYGPGRPKTLPWMTIDREAGVLSGTPRAPGAFPIIVTAFVTSDSRGKLDPTNTVADARLIVIQVEE